MEGGMDQKEWAINGKEYPCKIIQLAFSEDSSLGLMTLRYLSIAAKLGERSFRKQARGCALKC